MNDLIGKTLGQYEIREKVGQGGMAQVFKAYQASLDRFVAVKVLPPTLAGEPGFTERFQREALSAARLHHPHILEVYDFGVQENFNYLVMRYVEGSRTLGDLIQADAEIHTLIGYIVQVADALNYAHERGVIHRDVKPGNILIDGKWALLADFGLAKIREASSQLTATGIGMGTPAYMSPEQASGVQVDARTDIYALGIILYRILTGTVPHDAPTPFAILAKRCSEPVTSARTLNPAIPESLNHVVLRSLAMSPGDRYPSATHFAEALQKAETDPNYREESITALAVSQEGTTTFHKPGQVEGATIAPEAPTSLASKLAVRRTSLGLLVGLGAAIALLVVGGLLFLALLLTSNRFISAAQPTSSAQTPGRVTTPAVVSEGSVSTPLPIKSPLAGTPVAMAQTDLEVRSGPGNEYELLGYLPQGATAEIVGRDGAGGWWQIKTSLAAGGGWIKAGPAFSQASDINNVPIALAPPTPTGTATPVSDTPTPTVTPAPDTPTPTVTPVPDTPTATPMPPTVTRVAPPAPTATQTRSAPAGGFVLLKPASLEEPSYGPTEFVWQWGGSLGANQGFEVRVWREGEPPAGAHDAVADNKSGRVVAQGNGTYSLTIDIRDAAGVQGRTGEYLWTVVLVQISPEYKDLGQQAPPGRLRFDAGGDKNKDKGGGGGSTL